MTMNEQPRMLGEQTKVYFHYAVTLRFQMIHHPRDHLVQILLWNKKQGIQPLLLDVDAFEKKFEVVIGERVETSVNKAKALKSNFGTSKDMENTRKEVIDGLLVEFIHENLHIEGNVDDKHHELKVVLLPDDLLYTEPILLLQHEEKLQNVSRISDWSSTLRKLDNDWAQENLPATLRSSFNFALFNPIEERRENIKKIFQRVYEKVIVMNRAKKIKKYFEQFLKQQHQQQQQQYTYGGPRRPSTLLGGSRRPSALSTGLRRLDSFDHSLHSLSSQDSSVDCSSPKPGLPFSPHQKGVFLPSPYSNTGSPATISEKKTNVLVAPALDEGGSDMVPFIAGSILNDDLYNAIYLDRSPETDITTTPKLPFIGGPFVAGSKRPPSAIKPASMAGGGTSSDDLTQSSKNQRPKSVAGNALLVERPKSPTGHIEQETTSTTAASTTTIPNEDQQSMIQPLVASASSNNLNQPPLGFPSSNILFSASSNDLNQPSQGIRKNRAQSDIGLERSLPTVNTVSNSSGRSDKSDRTIDSVKSLSTSDSVSSFDLLSPDEQQLLAPIVLSPLLASGSNKSIQNSPVARRGVASEKVMPTGRSPMFPLPAITITPGSRNVSLAGSRAGSKATSRNTSPAGSRRGSRASSPVDKKVLKNQLVRYYSSSF